MLLSVVNQPFKLSVVMPAFPTDMKLGWKALTVTKALAYSAMELIAIIKSFIIQAQCLQTDHKLCVLYFGMK